MKMKPNSPAKNRLERGLRILVSRQQIVAATPVAVRFVPLLLRRSYRCPTSPKWQFRVTEYCVDKHPTT